MDKLKYLLPLVVFGVFSCSGKQPQVEGFANTLASPRSIVVVYEKDVHCNMEEYKKEQVDFATVFEGYCRSGFTNINPEVQPIIVQPYNSLVVDIDVNHVSMIIQRLCSLSCMLTTTMQLTRF